MWTPEQMKTLMELFAQPLFRQGAADYVARVQMEGLEAARKFWAQSPFAGGIADPQQMMERLADAMQAMGFVPLARHEALQRENAELKSENEQLRNTLRELQQSLIAEGSAKAQQAWQEVVDKQMEINREATRGFFEALKQFNPPQS